MDKWFWFMVAMFVAVIVFCIVSCKNAPEPYSNVIVVDGCEYIVQHYHFTHKGNCKSCEQRLRKIIKEELGK